MKHLLLLLLTYYFTINVLYAQSIFKESHDSFHTVIYNDLITAKKELEKQSELKQTDIEHSDYYSNIGLYYAISSKYDSAASFYDKALSYTLVNDYKRLVAIGRSKALILNRKGDFIESNNFINEFTSSYKLEGTTEILEMQYMRVNNYLSLHKYDSALNYGKNLNASIGLLKEVDKDDELSHRVECQLLLTLATVFNEKSFFDSSIIYYKKAKEIIKDDEVNFVAGFYQGIGNVYQELKQANKALSYYKRGVSKLNKFSEKSPLIILYYNIANIYQIENTDSAEHYFNLSYKLAKKYNYVIVEATSLNGLGNIALERNNQLLANKQYMESIDLFNKIGHMPGLFNSYLGLQKLNNKINNYGIALSYSDKAMSIAQSLKSLELLSEGYNHRSTTYKLMGSLDSAMSNKEKFYAINDSIKGISIQKNIDDIEVKYQTEVKEKENLKLKHKIEVFDQKRRFWFVTVMLSLLLLGGVVALLSRANKLKKQRLRIQEIHIANQDISRELVLSNLNKAKGLIQEKNKLISELEDEANNNIDIETASKSLIAKINTHNEWAEFTAEFEMLYKGFFNRLTEKSLSKLSPNELRLASLIKLNLSNKEIAEILYISPDSVKKAKQRFVKKLQVDEGQKISEFILEL